MGITTIQIIRANNNMTNPLKLILTGLFALLWGCSESADLKKPVKNSKRATEYFESANRESSATAAGFVAGLAPNQRPVAAPIIREFVPGAEWRARSLAGVSSPIPASLDFIDSQGAWYTPFNQPGMPGYYDLRNLHNGARNSNRSEPITP